MLKNSWSISGTPLPGKTEKFHILVLSEVGVAKLCPYIGAFWPGFKDWYENRRTRVRDAPKTQSLGAVGSSQQEVTHLELSCHVGCFAHTLLILSEGFYPVTFNFGDFQLDLLEIKKRKNYEFLSIHVTLVWHMWQITRKRGLFQGHSWLGFGSTDIPTGWCFIWTHNLRDALKDNSELSIFSHLNCIYQTFELGLDCSLFSSTSNSQTYFSSL